MRINQSFPRVGPVRGKNRKNRFSKESQSVIESLDRTSFFLNRENKQRKFKYLKGSYKTILRKVISRSIILNQKNC